MNGKKYIASRAAQELKDKNIVNLGIGIPTMVTDYLSNNISIYIHSENGVLGVGPTPTPENIDNELINASKLPITINKGASFFDSSISFSMIRGNHIDVAILGVLQVDQLGRVANWAVPGQNILGVGGAMDLLAGAKKVIITTLHNTKDSKPKIVKKLSYPKTSNRKVDKIITEKAVFDVDSKGLVLVEVSPGVTIEDIYKSTDAFFRVSDKVRCF